MTFLFQRCRVFFSKLHGSSLSYSSSCHNVQQHTFHSSSRSTLHTLFTKPTTSTSTASRVSPRSSDSSFSAATSLLGHVLLKPRTVPIPRWISPKHYSITLSECLGHASFLLVAASYATDDFILLRTIAVMGSTAMVFFVYFHPNGKVLWLPFRWNVLFIGINLYRIGYTYYETYMAHRHLPPIYQQIREDHYWNVDPVDFYKLVQLAQEEFYYPGDVILTQGELNPDIHLVVKGNLDVYRDGIKTYPLEEGNFISESGLHAGLMLTGVVASNSTIIATTTPSSSSSKVQGRLTQDMDVDNDYKNGSRIKNNSMSITTSTHSSRGDHTSSSSSKTSPIILLKWNRTQLMHLLEKEKHLRNSLKASLTWDIVRKLKGQRQMLARHEVSDPELWTVKRNEQNEDRYAAILLNMSTHPEYFTQRKRELDKYRIVHHIDDEHHRLALQKWGWTEEEYKMGKKLQT